MTRQAEENKQHDAALDDLLKQKQELIQERDNQASLAKVCRGLVPGLILLSKTMKWMSA